MNVNIYGGKTTLLISLFRKKHLKKVLITLTVFILSGTAGSYFCFHPKVYTNEELFDMYYIEPDISARGTDTEVGLFYKSITHIKLKEYQEAMKDLQLVLNECGQMHDHAKWYMMLCLLKTNSSEDIISAYLCDIARKRGRYSKQAAEILYHKSNQQNEEDNP